MLLFFSEYVFAKLEDNVVFVILSAKASRSIEVGILLTDKVPVSIFHILAEFVFTIIPKFSGNSSDSSTVINAHIISFVYHANHIINLSRPISVISFVNVFIWSIFPVSRKSSILPLFTEFVKYSFRSVSFLASHIGVQSIPTHSSHSTFFISSACLSI